MAQVLQFNIKANDQASRELKEVGRNVDQVEQSTLSLNTALVAGAAAFAAVAAVAVKSVAAYAKQELAVKKLNDALALQGVSSAAYSADLQAFASSLQSVTKFGDETILELQSLLVTFGLVGDELKTSTAATLDLASALNIDLKAAALLIGKAFAGDTSSLSRYGIKIDETIPKTERFAELMRIIATTMGGRAAGETDTVSGAFAQFGNIVGDVFERVGELIVKATGLADVFKTATKWLNEFYLSIGGGDEIDRLRQKMGELQEELGDLETFGSRSLDSRERMAGVVQRTAETVAEEINTIRQEIVKLTNERSRALREVQETVDTQRDVNDVLDEETKKRMEALAAMKEQYAELKKIQGIQDTTSNIITGGSTEAIEAQRGVLREQLNAIDLQSATTAEEFKLLAARKEVLESMIDKLDDATDKLKKSAAEIRQDQVFEIAQSALAVDAPGLGAGISTALGATGPQGQVIALMIQLVESAEQLPRQISETITNLTQGLVKGVPDLIEYLHSDFIRELLTNLIPALAAVLPNAVAGALRGVGNLIKDFPGIVADTFKGIGTAVWDGFKAVGGAIAGLFGFGGDNRSPAEKLADTVKELADLIRELNRGLYETYRELRGQVLGEGAQRIYAISDFNRATLDQVRAARRFREAGRSGDEEAAAQAAAEQAAAQQEALRAAKRIYDFESQRLDEALAKEKEIFEARVKVKEEEIAAAEKLIQTYTSLRDSAVNAIDSVRQTIINQMRSPAATVAELQGAFDTASTPEARSQAAIALAGGLQNQFSAAQNLAASGAISGEEFARIQEQILTQLDATEDATVSEFDRLISAQERIIKRADRQIDTLRAGFDKFETQIEQQRAELKSYFLSMIRELNRVNTNLNTWSPWRTSEYRTNTYNIRGRIQSGSR